MKEIIKKLQDKNIFEIIFILLMIFICSKIYDFHIVNIMCDRGRELFIPEAIADGKVPYRDILLLYFPLGYYLNALFMLIGKVSLNSLFWAGVINCTIFAILFFELSKEFISKKMSLIFTAATISVCMFSHSLFSYIFPYSYSMVYGLTAYLAATLLLVKFAKTNNEKLLYFAGLFSGLSFALKAEFMLMPIIFLAVLFWKNFSCVKTKIISIINLLISPIITMVLPILQGAKISDIANYFSFISNFSHTKSMIAFYQGIGTIFSQANIPAYISGSVGLIILIIASASASFLFNKNKNKLIYAIIFLVTCSLLFVLTDPFEYFVLLPITVLMVFIAKFKEIKNNKIDLILVISTICLCTKSFAMLSLNKYGTFYLPLLILTIFVLLKYFKIENKFFKNLNSIFIFISLFFIAYAEMTAIYSTKYCNEKIETDKGYVYLCENQGKYIHQAVDYLKNNTNDTDKVLVLPEGQIINFLANRKNDTRLHMLDRLYFDGLGSENAKKLLEETNNDYIIIVKGFLLSDFGEKYLYGEKNDITDFIKSNYDIVEFFGDKNDNVTILKKN